MKRRKRTILWNTGIFAGVMILTLWSVFRKQNISELVKSVQVMSIPCLLAAVFLAVFYVFGEGSMIWYLSGKMGKKTRLWQCAKYSFVGFFFSGLTPSATGGQPVQLYYMKKDGYTLSASSVVLMTVAVLYKLILVLIGTGILLLWYHPLREYLKGYFVLYVVGLFLNIILVAVLLTVMFRPKVIQSFLTGVEKLLIHIKIWKRSDARQTKIEQFINGYHETVLFLKRNKEIYGVMLAGTFIQRVSVFVLTYVVYYGMGLRGTAFLTIILLQASVYVAVDMLPVPGAQGITEAMYKSVFCNIFPGQQLITSMCITRGISFYFIMVISFFVWGVAHFLDRKKLS